MNENKIREMTVMTMTVTVMMMMMMMMMMMWATAVKQTAQSDTRSTSFINVEQSRG